MTQPWYWVNNNTRDFLKTYLLPGETVEERVLDICNEAQKYLEEMFQKKNPGKPLPVEISTFSEKFYEGIARGWASFSSPVWSNFGRKRKGLPASCNNVYVPDSMEDILFKSGEVGFQTKVGAGTSGYFGDLRARNSPLSDGGAADGPVGMLEIFQANTNIITQGKTRRGAFAGYLDVRHPDILEWISARSTGHRIQDVFTGVCIDNQWMAELLEKNPERLKVWAKILRQRDETGQPYIFYTDNANQAAPEVYKEKRYKIKGSNLCTEVMLHSDRFQSYVCILGSKNLLHWDEWKDTNFPFLYMMFLDAVTEEYILKSSGKLFLTPAREFCYNQRAVGLGTLGLHSLFQEKGLPFESREARELDVKIHKHLDQQTLQASKQMAVWFGEPPLLEGKGLRNVTRMAIAPTTSSSFILGAVSQGIEPIFGNAHTKDLAKGKYIYRNPQLQKVLEAKGKDTEEVWEKIEADAGSVANLPFLSEHEKAVFKTFPEISQEAIVRMAAARGKYIDQGQSLNLCFDIDTAPKEISRLLILGWELGLKSFYYQRAPQNPAQKLSQKITEMREESVFSGKSNDSACLACEA